MQLQVYNTALSVLEELGVLAVRIARHDRDLARQLRRASTSVLLNIAEGERHTDGHRRARFETAIGSANESIACLDAAVALGYVAKDAVASAQDGFDKVARTLTHLKRR